MHAVKYNSLAIIKEQIATFPGATFLQALSISFNNQGLYAYTRHYNSTNCLYSTGQGLFYCSTSAPRVYLTFPLAQPGSDQIFSLNSTDFHSVHDISKAEETLDTVPFSDLLQSVTTWSTGGAVAFPEISSISGTNYARLTVSHSSISCITAQLIILHRSTARSAVISSRKDPSNVMVDSCVTLTARVLQV